MPIPPDWLGPVGLPLQVGAVMSTRRGGSSRPPWDSLNLGHGSGDVTDAVTLNRRLFARAIGAAPVYLRQVHGTQVVRIDRRDAAPAALLREADASVTTEPGVACTVLVADCLPVLLAAPEGRAVAAAHAGWRGLAGGVVEAALSALCEAAPCDARDVVAWLGACIGPQRFEVGADVLLAFGAGPSKADPRRFAPGAGGASRRWFANLPVLARDRLQAAGVRAVTGASPCTASDASRFFSYRRDGVTGRMAAAIWIRK